MDTPSSPSLPVASAWQLRSRRLEFGELPVIMGIVNVTPDSFSDGGHYFDPQRAVDHAIALAEQGADILDVGGESTRPYSEPVPEDEEVRRTIRVVRELCDQVSIPVSIDTSKAAVARAALESGAEIINDVTGLEGDPEMVAVARQYNAAVCAMHMQGTPQTMQDDPAYDDVVAEIYHYLRRRRDRLCEQGIDPERLCLDPGIGFGKTHQHNLTLLASCHRFHSLGHPLLVGHSRKGFIGKILGNKERDRAAGTVGVSVALAVQRIQVLRVHDVQTTCDALQLFAAVGGLSGKARQLPE